MEITLTPDQKDIIQHEIDNGRLQSPEEAIEQALAQWEERRRDLIDLLSALDEAEEDFKTGRYVECTEETLPQIKAEILRNAGIGSVAAAKCGISSEEERRETWTRLFATSPKTARRRRNDGWSPSFNDSTNLLPLHFWQKTRRPSQRPQKRCVWAICDSLYSPEICRAHRPCHARKEGFGDCLGGVGLLPLLH